MQLADEAEAIANDDELREFFIYYDWMERDDIPRDVTHVRIHASVRRIKDEAFKDRTELRIAILNAGLEEIGRRAFRACHSLEGIVIPDAVKRIEEGAFHSCFRLTSAILGNGLEEIGKYAFGNCSLLEEIVIPPAVRKIHDDAFDDCTNLTRVKFSDEIESFVACDAMQDWWNQGVGKTTMRTYSFLVRCNVPERFKGLSKISSWQANIHDMLRIIPTIEDINAHFDTIDAKLTLYENLLREVHELFLNELGFDEGVALTILSYH